MILKEENILESSDINLFTDNPDYFKVPDKCYIAKGDVIGLINTNMCWVKASGLIGELQSSCKCIAYRPRYLYENKD